jgi:aquaglyceroporin related protein
MALWLYRGFPGRKVGWYIAAQVLGATLASFIVYSNYRFSIGLFEGQGLPSSIRTVTGPHATAPLFFTFPQPWLPNSSAFLSEAIASGVLVCVVFALGDKGNLPPPKGTMAFAMFIVLIGIGASMGVNTGYAVSLSFAKSVLSFQSD